MLQRQSRRWAFLLLGLLLRVLEACPTGSATGVRDRAVLLLLARLGLRASKVATLRLEDLDWHEGRLLVRAGKSDRERNLPCPGDIPAGPLRRPWVSDVFTQAHPPYGPLAAAMVTALAQQALRRAGITVYRPGAHTFRHTAATQMVRAGVSFRAVTTLSPLGPGSSRRFQGRRRPPGLPGHPLIMSSTIAVWACPPPGRQLFST
jgi:integrase